MTITGTGFLAGGSRLFQRSLRQRVRRRRDAPPGRRSFRRDHGTDPRRDNFGIGDECDELHRAGMACTDDLSFSPASGGPYTAITINGTNFLPQAPSTTVTLNGQPVSIAYAINNTNYSVTLGQTASSGRLVITTPGGTATSATDSRSCLLRLPRSRASLQRAGSSARTC